jgi:hypothetical protein
MSEQVGAVDENKTPEKTKEESSEYNGADVSSFETGFYLDVDDKPRAVQLSKSKGFGREPGSIRRWLDGKVNEKDGVRINRLLSKIGMAEESDLDDLGEGLFESTPEDAKPIVVLLLWRVLRQHGLLPPLHRVQEPSLKKTILGMKSSSTEAACLDQTPDFMKKNLQHLGKGVNATAFASASNLPPLPENSVGDDGAPPPTPRCQRVDPATRRGRQSTGMFTVDMLGGFQQADGSEHVSVTNNKPTPGLWQALPPLGGGDAATVGSSAEAKALQLKVRGALIKEAVKGVSAFTDNAEDWVEWRDATIEVFKATGRKEVLLPHFREWADDQGWSADKIKEVDGWAHAVLKDGILGHEAAIDAFDLAPVGSGSVVFAHMRRQFEIMGSFVKNKLRLKIENFKPEAAEDPPAMIRRLNKLYKKHALQLNPETVSEETKIRRVLDLAERHGALEGKVRAIRECTTSARVDPETISCACICVDLQSQWLAWGEEETFKIKVTKADMQNRVLQTEAKLRVLEKEMDDKIKTKVAHAAASKDLGQGEPGGLGGDPPTRNGNDRRIDHGPCCGTPALARNALVVCLLPLMWEIPFCVGNAGRLSTPARKMSACSPMAKP